MGVKHHKSYENMRSDKCKKGGFDSCVFFYIFVNYLRKLALMGGQIWCMFVPIFGDLGAFLGYTSLSILARFAECWGSLETSRGSMLEVIGAVGSRSGLC